MAIYLRWKKPEPLRFSTHTFFDLNRTIRAKQPFVPANNGATLALRQINSALQNYWHKTREPEPGSELDLV